ncbi:MAG: mechanosensitive ion channel, partial [Acidobacteria bacterium]|nr:mechanosensitive ion channel [Acidobacteriota bacterium]
LGAALTAGSLSAQPQAIPAAEIPAREAQARSRMRDIRNALDKDSSFFDLPGRVHESARRIEELRGETEEVLAGRPSIGLLEDLQGRWKTEIGRIQKLQDQVDGALARLESRQSALQQDLGVWRATDEVAGAGPYPEALRRRAASVVADLNALQDDLAQRQQAYLGLQGDLGDLRSRSDEDRGRVVEAGRRKLLTFDQPPLWTALARDHVGGEMIARLNSTLERQRRTLTGYLRNEPRRLAAQSAFLLALLFLFVFLRRHVRRWGKGAEMAAAARALERPASAALVVALAATGLFHPDAPRSLIHLALLAILVPLVRLLSRIIHIGIRLALLIPAALYILQRIVGIATYSSLSGRLLLLLLTVLTLACVEGLRLRVRKKRAESAWWKAVGVLARGASALTLLSLIANVLGSLGLAYVLTQGVLTALYLALLLHAACLVTQGLAGFLLGMGGILNLRVLQAHGAAVRGKVNRLLALIALLVWIAGTMSALTVWDPVIGTAVALLTAPLQLGRLQISPGDILSFVIVIWVSILFSRFIRFLLDEEIFPRLTLARGIPGTVSKLTHYSLVALGFLVAISAAGFGLDRLTVLAGAFGIGIGFGLQDVVKNFVSGLILLFERPIKIGDIVQLGDLGGEVTGIGIRASTIRTWEGADVVVPNGNLLSDRLVNWTLADPLRRIEVQVGVAYGTDPKRVLDLLQRVATRHPEVIDKPAPMGLFLGFGDSSLNFSMRVWTRSYDRFVRIKSELTVAVNDALKQEGIEIPFPQRDLHIRSADAGLASFFRPSDS